MCKVQNKMVPWVDNLSLSVGSVWKSVMKFLNLIFFTFKRECDSHWSKKKKKKHCRIAIARTMSYPEVLNRSQGWDRWTITVVFNPPLRSAYVSKGSKLVNIMPKFKKYFWKIWRSTNLLFLQPCHTDQTICSKDSDWHDRCDVLGNSKLDFLQANFV